MAKSKIKFSIIIPAYNAEPYLKALVDCLRQQVTDEVEVLIIDDGSSQKVTYQEDWLKVYRQKNKGAGAARNKGIDKAKGDYLAFVDADDLVASDYVKQVLKKIEEDPFDVCDVSWKSQNKQGVQFDKKLKTSDDWLTNPSACTRVFSREFIGETRFSEIKDATQDEDFSRRAGYLDKDKVKRHTAITDYMYFYRTNVSDSQSKKYRKGLRKTKKVVYHYDHVTKDMTDLIEQIKKDDEQNEVWLLTKQCDIPELKRWCQIYPLIHTWTHYLKGEPYRNIEIIPVPHECDVVLYVNFIQAVGGIETFVKSFCKAMSKYYHITYVVNRAPEVHIREMEKVTEVIWNQPDREIICDTLIRLRIIDHEPHNIKAKKTIQMCHACRTNPRWHIPQDNDYIVTVSETSRKSFEKEGDKALTIHNLIDKEHQKPLVLMSATRLPAIDKGHNEERMIKLAKMLEAEKIPYIWMNFSDGELRNAPKGFHNMGMVMNASDYFTMADYIVQLSDSEAWSYTVLEALTQNVPVLVTPFPSGSEMGIIDGQNGYVIPFDMDFDVRKLLERPVFEYEYDNDAIIEQWRKLIAKKPIKTKQRAISDNLRIEQQLSDPRQQDMTSGQQDMTSRQQDMSEPGQQDMVKVKVNCKYRDMILDEWLRPGMIRYMTKARAEAVAEKGYIRIMEGQR